MTYRKIPKEFQLSEEEKEFIHSMKEKTEPITSNKIDEAITWISQCLENDNINEAITCLIAASAMSKYLKDIPRLVESAMQRGEILTHAGEYEEAIEQYQNILRILQESTPIFGFCKDKEAEATCYANTGEIYNILGMLEKAKQNISKSIAITDAFQIPDVARSNHIELGSIYLETGYIEKALHHFEKARSCSSPDAPESIDILLNMANVYADLGYIDKAHTALDEALSICEFHRSSTDKARLCTNKGYLFAQDENWEKALIQFEKALKIRRKMHDKKSEALLLTNIGHIFHAQKNTARAVAYYKKALILHEEYNNKEGQAAVHNSLGTIAAETKDYQTALTHYTLAKTLFQDLGFLPDLQLLYKNMGLLFHKIHNTNKAITMYEKSINLLEKIRGFSEIEEIKIRLTGEREDVFGYMIAALCENNDTERVFQYIERAKSYTLTNLLEKKKVLTCTDFRDYQNLKIEHDILYSRKIRYRNWPEMLNSQLIQKQRAIEKLKKKIYTKYSESADLLGTRMNISDIYDFLGDSILIEYYVFIDGLYAVLLGKNVKTIEIVEFTPSIIEKFDRETFIKRIMRTKFSPLSDVSELYTILFSPLERYLNPGQHICIVPHGILHHIPFHALFDGDHYLIENYRISYVPSAAVLTYCMRRKIRKGNQYFVTGRKNLSTEKEAREIAALLKTEISEPSKDIFEKNCMDKDIIHLACHSVFLKEDPLGSYIAFQDGNLKAETIFNLNLQADLVVLSACESGVSEVAGGDELMGFSRAFLFAGAKSLIHSLWPAYGVSSKELMVKFYENLLQGHSKLDSLRNAQLELLYSSRFNDPFHWSPFVLVGDWR